MTTSLSLPDVTLIAVSSVAVAATVRALEVSARHIEFAAVRLLTSEPPDAAPSGMQVIPIDRLDLPGYSQFILRRLHHHIGTTHCLIVQADGFVLDAMKWNPRFLDYDYIGAPWPVLLPVGANGQYIDFSRNRVGNGGFSLRSRRLLETVAQLDLSAVNTAQVPEDLVICHLLYGPLCALGIRFAPLDLALRFSAERPVAMGGEPLSGVFGFHGRHFLAEANGIVASQTP